MWVCANLFAMCFLYSRQTFQRTTNQGRRNAKGRQRRPCGDDERTAIMSHTHTHAHTHTAPVVREFWACQGQGVSRPPRARGGLAMKFLVYKGQACSPRGAVVQSLNTEIQEENSYSSSCLPLISPLSRPDKISQWWQHNVAMGGNGANCLNE